MPAPFTLVVEPVTAPALVVHGGAGSYLATTTPAQRRERGEALAAAARAGWAALAAGDARGAVLAAVAALEADERFNAGRGSRLQRDGRCRLSASLMDGRALRLSAVYNVEGCLNPSRLAAALQARGDRNLDGAGARLLMEELGVAPEEVRTRANVLRWQALVAAGDAADPESAVGDADDEALEAARRAGLPLPPDLRELPPEERRHGTVGAVALGADGALWACTSTGGRGHESVGRVSDSPTPAGNYACPEVGLSATGFGEQILDLNLCGRIAARVADGMGLRGALDRTFREAAARGHLFGVIGLSAAGELGWAHTTEACGVAWIDARGRVGLDRHSEAAPAAG